MSASESGESRLLIDGKLVTASGGRVFDNVNDNRQYLSAGQVANSFTPLDFFDVCAPPGNIQAYPGDGWA